MSNSELYVIELGGDIGDIATMHRLVRCKDCALYDREDGLCYRDPSHSGYYRPAHDDGFCAWGERREDTDA